MIPTIQTLILLLIVIATVAVAETRLRIPSAILLMLTGVILALIPGLPAVELAPEGEREEVRQIFQSKGFEGKALDSAVDVITEQHERWIDTMMTEEHGMPPMTRSPTRSALFTFLAFVLCGSVPLLAYLFRLNDPLAVATVMTGATFFAIGSLRSHWSPTPWWRAGLETFVIGMIAALVAYLVGDFLQSIV